MSQQKVLIVTYFNELTKHKMENLFLDPTLILIIAAFAGFFMAFGIGANDVANATVSYTHLTLPTSYAV